MYDIRTYSSNHTRLSSALSNLYRRLYSNRKGNHHLPSRPLRPPSSLPLRQFMSVRAEGRYLPYFSTDLITHYSSFSGPALRWRIYLTRKLTTLHQYRSYGSKRKRYKGTREGIFHFLWSVRGDYMAAAGDRDATSVGSEME